MWTCSGALGPVSVLSVPLPLPAAVVHALLVCNASAELAGLNNLRDHFHPATLPLTRSLLTA